MNANETAVIFIEFQNDFCKEKGKLYDAVREEISRNGTIENAKTLLQSARKKGCKIIHCPFTLDAEWVKDKESEGILRGISDGRIFARDTWGHQIIEDLAPADGEVVLVGKRALSAFSHTNLDSLLRFSGIKNLIVCGFLTNICAQATAWSAYDLGYHVRMVSKACGATSENIQNYVEENICPILGGDFTVENFEKEVL